MAGNACPMLFGANKLNTMAPMSNKRRWLFLTNCGSNIPSRSRGHLDAYGARIVGDHRLPTVAVAELVRTTTGQIMLAAAQMLIHILVQHGLHNLHCEGLGAQFN